MIAFVVPQGTEAIAIRAGEEWMGRNLRRIRTAREHLFVLEDVIVDPLGKIGTGPDSLTIGGSYAKAGWYGFQRHDDCGHPDTAIGRATCRTGWILLTANVQTG